MKIFKEENQSWLNRRVWCVQRGYLRCVVMPTVAAFTYLTTIFLKNLKVDYSIICKNPFFSFFFSKNRHFYYSTTRQKYTSDLYLLWLAFLKHLLYSWVPFHNICLFGFTHCLPPLLHIHYVVLHELLMIFILMLKYIHVEVLLTFILWKKCVRNAFKCIFDTLNGSLNGALCQCFDIACQKNKRTKKNIFHVWMFNGENVGRSYDIWWLFRRVRLCFCVDRSLGTSYMIERRNSEACSGLFMFTCSCSPWAKMREYTAMQTIHRHWSCVWKKSITCRK